MDKLLTLTIIGLSTAGAFAIAASGLVLTYTTTGVFNFAHGAIGMLGAFAFWQLHVEWGLPTWLAMTIVLLVVAPLFGVLLEVGVWRPLRGAADATQLVVSVALLAACLGLGQWAWEPERAFPLEHLWGDSAVHVGGVSVRWHAVFTLGMAATVALGLWLLLAGTRAGITMRATVDDRRLTLLNGARPDRAAMLAWAIGCSTAALSGILIAPDRGLQHVVLTLLIVNAYAAAVLGRLRSLPLAFLGAVVLGLADAYGNGYIRVSDDFLGGIGPYLGGFVTAIPVLLLFVVLLALPQSRLRGHVISRSLERFPLPTWQGTAQGCALLLGGTAVVSALLSDADAASLQKLFGIAIVGLSLVPLVGYAGQISLCQMSFAGIGAVVMAHHGAGGSLLGLVAAAVVAGLVGAVVALPTLRLSGIYLALATAAFAVVLDRWIFILPSFDVGPLHVALFDQAVVPVSRIHVPGLDSHDPHVEAVVLAALFCLLWLAVVAVRRSGYGERLLAMKDSPAACATLGLDLTATKLSVFALSAAIAGIGGAVYGGALASVSPDSFGFFQSLPVLLLAVAGGIGSPLGALIGASTLQLIPIVAGSVTWLAGPASIVPGLIGISLGRSPNGVAPDLGDRLAPLRHSVAAAAAALSAGGVAIALFVVGLLPGWPLGVVLVVTPFTAARLVHLRGAALQPGGPVDESIEYLGLDEPVGPDRLRELDAALALPPS